MSPRWNPNPEVRMGRHVVCNLHAHLVFITKYRRGALTDAMLIRTEEVMREVCADFEAHLKQFDGGEDHVRLLVHYPPKVQLSKLVNSLKGVSSRRLRQEYDSHVRRHLWGGHFWSGSYFAGSCGGAPLTVVEEYVEKQQRLVS
ncbi:IS200/IS605 family transposase [Streptomyces sp. V4I2]|uniref:IS200/IS605 family transposase n=1 Tax=Streptomyces sp. V4I2 TaxID=3042280 RepID=UPI0027824123|nr:IS200/IS605 family transposase [Streptomyces sp. V4I2]MDQ1050319.1 putative transposase [Streptomyces sp. V4I2]